MKTNLLNYPVLILLIGILWFPNAVKAQCPTGDVELNTQQDIVDFATNYPTCTVIGGALSIVGNNISDLSPLANLTSIGGQLVINKTSLNNLDGLLNLTSVGQLTLAENEMLQNTDGLSNVETILGYGSGGCYIGLNPILESINLSQLTTTEVLIIQDNNSLVELDGLSNLASVKRLIYIRRNNALENIGDFSKINSVSFSIDISTNPLLVNLGDWSGLTLINNFYVFSNPMLTDFDPLCPIINNATINGSVTVLDNGAEFDPDTDCICPSGDVVLNTQQEVENFVATYPNCTEIAGRLIIQGSTITDLSLLSNLESVARGLTIENTSLENLDGLSNLQSTSGIYIYDNSALTNIEGISNLQSIGEIRISRNSSLENVEFPILTTLGTSAVITENNSLQQIIFSNVQGTATSLAIRENPSLIEIDFSNLSTLRTSLSIQRNAGLTNLDGFTSLRSLSKDLIITENSQLINFEGLCPLFTEGRIYGSTNISSNGIDFDPAECFDEDGDGISNTDDNCPSIANPDQSDIDGDGIGDVCDDELSVEGAGAILIEEVESLELHHGLERALGVKINEAISSCASGDSEDAMGSLQAFINQVEAKRNKPLSDEEADAFIAIAQAMIDAIQNGTSDCGSGARVGRELSTDLKAYPNPFQNNITIEWKGTAQDVTVSLTNLMGQQVYRQQLRLQSRQQLAIGVLPKGIYILEVVGEDFKQEMKVMKE